MLSTVIDRVANNFKNEDTRIITVTDFTAKGGFKSDFAHTDVSKNLIILIDNATVMGNVDMNVRRNTIAVSDSTEELNPRVVSVSSVVERMKNMNSNKTLLIYYPSFEKYVLDHRLTETKLGNTDEVTIRNETRELDSLLTPDGMSLVIVIEKGQNPVSINLTRPSYIESTCPVCPPCNQVETNTYSHKTYWGTTGTLTVCVCILLIILLIFMMSGSSESNSSGSMNKTAKSTPILPKPSISVQSQTIQTLASSVSSPVSSPVESIGAKLGKLKRFL
jgi:hypothetical protein